MNAWLDELHVERTVRVNGNHQNSALALLAPDSPAVDPNDFPDRSDCIAPPVRFFGIGDQPLWEGTLTQSYRFVAHMKRVTKLYPGARRQPGDARTLPTFPGAVQGLNIAACDSRALVVSVGANSIQRKDLADLAFDEAIAGRGHWWSASAEDWKEAVAGGIIRAVPRDLQPPYLAVLSPEPYGRFGTVLKTKSLESEPQEVRAALLEGLHEFQHSFAKQDRSTHILEGLRDGITWQETDASDWRKFLPAQAEGPR